MNKLMPLPIAFALAVALGSCGGDDDDTRIPIDSIKGYVQKGPFLDSASITVAELTGGLAPSGKDFTVLVEGGFGGFSIDSITVTSELIEVKAHGAYWNEVTNQATDSALTLYAVTDVSDRTHLNVNVLTHLERERVRCLVEQGVPFADAKKTAQEEVLIIFGVRKPDIVESELLSITQEGEDNAILLAISSILQGYQSVQELKQLLDSISANIREDGVLNDQNLGSVLVNNAHIINPSRIRSNLQAKYPGQGIIIPNFGEHVENFKNKTPYRQTNAISYPSQGEHGNNLLDRERTVYTSGNYSMVANLPYGTSLRVKIRGEFHWYLISGAGWNYGPWDENDNSRMFYSNRTGVIDFGVRLQSSQSDEFFTYTNQIEILVYEHHDEEPTWSKVISIE